jgi:hypothetical protein
MTEAVKLYLDQDGWVGLAAALRDAGYDAVATEEANRKGASDEDQLAYAIGEGRAILTHNARHFVPMVRALFFEGATHYGVIISPHLEKGELLHRTIALLSSVSVAEMANTLRYL